MDVEVTDKACPIASGSQDHLSRFRERTARVRHRHSLGRNVEILMAERQLVDLADRATSHVGGARPMPVPLALREVVAIIEMPL